MQVGLLQPAWQRARCVSGSAHATYALVYLRRRARPSRTRPSSSAPPPTLAAMGGGVSALARPGRSVALPPSLADAPPEQLATFGAGCYWGTEKYFRSFAAALPAGAVADMRVGFMGGPEAQPSPSYEDVCTGRSGHVEVLQLRFDPARVPYDALVAHFFTFHDPTQPNRQGNDAGPQYASAVFAHTDAQRDATQARVAALQALLDAGTLSGGPGFAGKRVATAVRPAGVFHPAHEEHQRYLERNPRGYCNHFVRFAWPPGACAS